MKVKNGSQVSVHYRGTLSDGTEFDSSRNRGWPLSFQVGSGQMISGFDSACLGMQKGEVKTVQLTPSEAYGERNPQALQPVPKSAFGANFNFEIGAAVQGNGPRGPFLAKIHSLEEEDVVLDLNHPLAGENLQFEIEMVSVDERINDPQTEELTEANQELWNESMKKAELYNIAKENGLKVTTRTTKENLIKALRTL